MKKILLVEDDKILSRSVDVMLTIDGYQTITVYNGEEALQKLLHQKFDLLITDIVMPRMDGIELISKIKKLNKYLPIMVISGKLNDNLVRLLKKNEINFILPKPLNPTRFRILVEKAVQH